MRYLSWFFIVGLLVSVPAVAQEIPDNALPSVKAPPQVPKGLRKELKKEAPKVAAPTTWWGKRSKNSQILLAGGGLSSVAGSALLALGSSMANNAIDRRHQLQRLEVLSEAERLEFADQSGSVSLGRTLYVSGIVLFSAGGLTTLVGGIL
jgi:hypothetical protein